jgi:hypothetical protein
MVVDRTEKAILRGFAAFLVIDRDIRVNDHAYWRFIRDILDHYPTNWVVYQEIFFPK